MALIFKKTRLLEQQIDAYLDTVQKGAILFKRGVRCFLQEGPETFDPCFRELRQLESAADDMRRRIENDLYTQTLIPEARGDVLGLIESTDKALNFMDMTLQQFSVETPQILPEFHTLYVDLAEASSEAVQAMVLALRAYFRDISAVRDHINKVIFFEKEADRLADKIKRAVFQSGVELCRKIHMRYFAYHIEYVSDVAEDVCDRVAIAAIKRLM